jgi:hypothetical protein
MPKNKVQFQAGYSLVELFKGNAQKRCSDGAGHLDFVALIAVPAGIVL